MSTVCTIKKVSNGFLITSKEKTFVVEGGEKKLTEFLARDLESSMQNLLKSGDVKMFIDIEPLTN